MNTFKKIYCRIFQKVFKLAIPILPYRNPEIIKDINDLPALLSKKKVKKPFIICDSFLMTSPLFESVISPLENAGIEYVVFGEVTPNPTVSVINKAKSIYINEGCDALIGFGGGSAIDCAKSVGAMMARKHTPIEKMEGILKVIFKTPYTVAIPTTAGTGSETTVTVVITNEKTQHKFPISDFPLIPNVAVLDCRFTRTLPAHLVATTGMDALVHAVEAYVGGSLVKASKKDALEALNLIFENLEEAHLHPENDEARQNMLYAAHLAGRAFSKSYVGYCHAVAHSLGGKYHIPHGIANAVLIAYTLEYYGESVYKKLTSLSIETSVCKEGTPPEECAKTFIEKIRTMNRNMGIPEKLSGICKEDIPALARLAAKEANPIYPVPRLMDAKELEKLYYDVMEA